MLVPLEEYAEYCPSYAGWGIFPLMPSLSAVLLAERTPETKPQTKPAKKPRCRPDTEEETKGDVRDMCVIA